MSAGSKPTGIKRSFATYGGLSGNWKAKVNDSKYLFDLCHATSGDIFLQFHGNVAGLQPMPIREVAPLITVRWFWASSTMMSPPRP